WGDSVAALLMAVLGGAGTLVGGVIGALMVFGLRECLSTLVPWWQAARGAVSVLTILYLPTGLMGIPERLRQRRAATGNREDVKKMAPVTSRLAREMSRQQGSRNDDNHLATTARSAVVGRRCC